MNATCTHLSGDSRGLGHILEAAVVPHGHKVLHIELDCLQRQLRPLRRGARRLASRLLGLQRSAQGGESLERSVYRCAGQPPQQATSLPEIHNFGIYLT